MARHMQIDVIIVHFWASFWGTMQCRREEKKNLHVSDLLAKFQIASGGEFANDRMILS